MNREIQAFCAWLIQPKNLAFLSLLLGTMTAVIEILMIRMKLFVFASIPLLLIPYIALVLGFFWLVKGTEISYFNRFLAGVGSFTLSSTILYFYIGITANPKFLSTFPIWVHLWRIGMFLSVAIIVNGLMTYLQSRFEVKLRY